MYHVPKIDTIKWVKYIITPPPHIQGTIIKTVPYISQSSWLVGLFVLIDILSLLPVQVDNRCDVKKWL